MDPEQVYQEVLQEEQGKGSSGPVAEGRAKAARVRAEKGSPHPREAKWWPGSQPHLEGGEAPEAEAAEEEPEEVVEAPAETEEQPAAEAPDEAPAPAAEAPPPAAAEAPAAQEAAEAPAAQEAAPTAEPAEAPAPAEQAPAAVAEAPPLGVTHGTPTGTRMRPEDGVATQAMLDGQQAVYQRRKLIDELVSTGAPAITAEEAGRPRAPFLALLYILIPLIAIMIIVSQDDEGGSAEASGGGEAVEQTEGGETGGGGLEIVAENIAFDKDTLEFPADEESTLAFVNNDAGTDHNVAIYPNEEDGIAKTNDLFVGEIFAGVETVDYTVPALEAGEYYFQCDVHPNMNGTATAS